ncbi:hypothetical protein GF345_01595 [Candidatus Woesearchaeota archaeon]|nr:hypothetical protein [Candidatus Woesearchaeota archaeon]
MEEGKNKCDKCRGTNICPDCGGCKDCGECTCEEVEESRGAEGPEE